MKQNGFGRSLTIFPLQKLPPESDTMTIIIFQDFTGRYGELRLDNSDRNYKKPVFPDFHFQPNPVCTVHPDPMIFGTSIPDNMSNSFSYAFSRFYIFPFLFPSLLSSLSLSHRFFRFSVPPPCSRFPFQHTLFASIVLFSS